MRIIKVKIIPQKTIPVEIINSQTPIFIQSGNGTDDYNNLKNIPKLNGEKIIGDKTSEDYGLEPDVLTNLEIEELLNNFT